MRYLPLTDEDRAAMLKAVGVSSIEALFDGVPPAARRAAEACDLPPHAGEIEVEAAMHAFASANMGASARPFFIGAGNYRHHVPAAVDALIQRGEFLTSYTPYQPEVSQGTLQALFEFQTQVALMTGMEVANASMYDGATACAEAAAMACRVIRRRRVLMSGGLHPHYAEVTRTLMRFLDVEMETLAPDPLGIEDLAGRVRDDLACVVVQTPDFFGRLRDLSALASVCKAEGVLLVVAVTEPVSLGLVVPPGDMGADIVVAEGQALGNAMNFGGPGVGLFATRSRYVRQMPGRLAGETVDVDGRRGWVLTLSTREQHIRREKATSNICTNSGLCALAFSIHMTLLGEDGFRRLAELNHARAVQLAERLEAVKGVSVLPDAFFNEFAVRLPAPAAPLVESLAARGILAGVPVSRFYPSFDELDEVLLVSATELTRETDMDALVRAMKEAL